MIQSYKRRLRDVHQGSVIDGIPAYASLAAAAKDHEIGLVVYVVPPKLTLESLREAKELGLSRIWVQPGAGSDDVAQFLEEENFHYLINDCVMVRA